MDLSHVQFRGRPVVRPSARHGSNAATWAGDAQRLPDQPPPVVGGLPAFVLAQAGLDPAVYRSAPLERRTAACLRALGASSEPDARARLHARRDLHEIALSAFLIGVSAFFRDAGVFDTLQRVVIPELRNRPGRIRVWSAGCSAGAELYSIALMLDEAGLLDRADLLGTDCRPDALAAAQAGLFTDEALATVDAGIRLRYFERTREGWRIAERVRQAATWQAADATRVIADGPWDLVLCRNVVIYLQSAAAEALFRGIAAALAPGGFLVLGKAERPPASLGLACVGRCVHRGPVHA